MSLKIYCRIRDGEYNKISQQENKCKISIKHKKTEHNFVIDKLWDSNTNNNTIFDDLFIDANKSFLTYWVAFGYTGSGKTYTTSNLIKNLYNKLLSNNRGFKTSISAIQIYNDDIYDLLNENNPLLFYKTDKLIIKNIIKKQTENIDEIINMIVNNRNTAKTEMNNTSSRSHAIITITQGKRKYIIVDMAGQETKSFENNNIHIQKQANHINLNMLALKECIRNINQKKNFVPYRRTLLTLALKPMFENKCNVAFICNVNLKQKLYYQIDSLRYASSLYRKNKKKDNEFIKVFETYTNYIADIGWYSCQERELWSEFKDGNFKNIKSAGDILNKKRKSIDKISEQIKSCESLLPKI